MNIELAQKIDRIHPYPAKFTVDLAIKYILKYSSEGDLIYDPFMGSGTSLLASSLTNRRAYGTDVNYIAILISKFKLMYLSNDEINDLTVFISDFESNYKDKIDKIELFSYPSIEHWFCINAIKVLSLIKHRIEYLKTDNEKLFCKLVMSSIINVLSNQESDTRYAAIEKPNMTIERLANVFIKKFKTSLTLFNEFNNEDRIILDDKALLLDSHNCSDILKPKSVDLIVTSPPYVNTYDYYLYHKHRMNWLGYDFKFSMENEIGSRREFSSQKHKETKFTDDIYSIFFECNKALKENGHVVLVMGDGKVSGKIYEAKNNMEQIGKLLDWDLIDYSYSLLDKTSRSFQKSYRTKGKKEHILVFKKH